MKALTIDDRSVSGMGGEVCHLVLDYAGHESQFINAPLVYDAKSFTSYTTEMADHILSAARTLTPDWVIMVLQGLNSSGQMAVATAIHEESPATKFLFISGYPHMEELANARSRGMNLWFEEIPFNPEEILALLENAV